MQSLLQRWKVATSQDWRSSWTTTMCRQPRNTDSCRRPLLQYPKQKESSKGLRGVWQDQRCGHQVRNTRHLLCVDCYCIFPLQIRNPQFRSCIYSEESKNLYKFLKGTVGANSHPVKKFCSPLTRPLSTASKLNSCPPDFLEYVVNGMSLFVCLHT